MEVIIAMAVFILSHVAIARGGLKPLLVDRLGERGYLAAYSVLSIALLAWVITALLAAERITLWPTPGWSYWFAVFVSLAAFILIGIGAVVANPLSVSFRRTGFSPQRPGVIGWVRHPLLIGLSLWGLAHMPGNGDWPSLALFAGAAVFGVFGTASYDRRLRRRIGDERWLQLGAGRGHIDRPALSGAALGLALWVALILLHPLLFNAHPLAVLRATPTW